MCVDVVDTLPAALVQPDEGLWCAAAATPALEIEKRYKRGVVIPRQTATEHDDASQERYQSGAVDLGDDANAAHTIVKKVEVHRLSDQEEGQDRKRNTETRWDAAEMQKETMEEKREKMTTRWNGKCGPYYCDPLY